MSVRTLQGNLLDAEEGIICQQVNCQKKMGAGFALAIKTKWPEVYEKYMSTTPELGLVDYIQVSPSCSVANIYGQDNIAAYAGQQVTDYDALRKAFKSIAEHCKRNGIKRVNIPFNFGCGLGGGEWIIVYNIIDAAFCWCHGIEVIIWKLP